MNPSQKKVVIIGPSFRFLSGISYYTAYLANALSEGVSTSVILFRHMLPKRLFFGRTRVGERLSTVSYHEGISVHEILDWYNPITWIAGYQILRSADVIILQWWTSSVAHMYLVLILFLRRKRPVIIEYHEVIDPFEYGILPLRIYAICTGSLIRSRASAFVVHSAADRDLVSGHFGINNHVIQIIPHGLYNQYPIYGKEEAKKRIHVSEKYVLLFFGLIRPYKGVLTLINAFEQIDPTIRATIHLLIVGETWEERESVLRAQTSPAASQITCIDRYVSDNEIPAYFSAADLLILPYLRASQSGVAHIGISYGLPVIASQVGGLAESLCDYEGTTFVKPGDAEDLKNAIETVITSTMKRYPAPEAMQWDTIRMHWENLFTAVLHSKKR